MKAKTRRKARVDLRGVDPDSPAAWEERLRREGLSMSRGENKKLLHVGDSNKLAEMQTAIVAQAIGFPKKPGSGPDGDGAKATVRTKPRKYSPPANELDVLGIKIPE